MKYSPKPKHVLIQVVTPKQEDKPGALILPNQMPAQNMAKVIAVGQDVTHIAEEEIVLYDKYHAKCVDEDLKIYSISMDGIICFVNLDQA